MNVLTRVLERVPVLDHEREEILAAAAAIPPGRGMREPLLSTATMLVRRGGGDPQPLQDLLDSLPSPGPFGFRPVTEACALMFLSGALVSPLNGLMATMCAMPEKIGQLVENLPMLNIMRRSVGDSLYDYYQVSTMGHRSFWNFGSQELERVGQDRLRLYKRGLFPGLTRYLFVPYHYSVLSMFGRTGSVEVMYQDDALLELEIRY